MEKSDNYLASCYFSGYKMSSGGKTPDHGYHITKNVEILVDCISSERLEEISPDEIDKFDQQSLYQFIIGLIQGSHMIFFLQEPKLYTDAPNDVVFSLVEKNIGFYFNLNDDYKLGIKGNDLIDLYSNLKKCKFYSKPIMQKIENAIFRDPSVMVELAHKDAIMPRKGRDTEVGYDLFIIAVDKPIDNEDIDKAHSIRYETGVKIELPFGYYGEIHMRSSGPKYGWILSNPVGIIDNTYRGTLKIQLTRLNLDTPIINQPLSIAQLIVKKQIFSKLVQVDKIESTTSRGESGFGSTGNKL